MKNYKRSDLACEAADGLEDIEGTDFSQKSFGDVCFERLKIITPEAAKRLGRKCGTYVTASIPELWTLDSDEIEAISTGAGEILRELICASIPLPRITCELSALIVGLGNIMITADAIGPRAVNSIDATRHIKSLDPSLFSRLGACQISAIAPGVLGKTGIESADMVKAACWEVHPHVIIVIDALAAGSVDRLAKTLQLSDTGINPGAGIGNLRSELSREALGIPVIAIGIPTVVDTSAVVYDALCRAGLSDNIPKELTDHLDRSERFYVTPKESDLMIEKATELIVQTISRALVIN